MLGVTVPYHRPEVDKAAYEAWLSEGNLKRATKKLAENGVFSNRNKPYTIDGLRKAAIRHMVNNYDEARTTLRKIYLENGYVVDENQLDRYMIRMAISALITPKRVKYWMQEHNLLEKHKNYIESMIAL